MTPRKEVRGTRVLETVVGFVEQSLSLLDSCEEVRWIGASQQDDCERRGASVASAFELRRELSGLLQIVFSHPLDRDALGFQSSEPAPEHPTCRVGSPVVLLAPIAG